ncbi:hypothetical protein [Nocardioides dilutus]
MFTAGDLLAFGFTDDLVDRIMRFLDDSAADLSGSKPETVVQGAFGGAPASVTCSGHAGRARHHVVEAINDMVNGLQGYHSSLDGMRRRAHQVDDITESDINRLIVRAEDCAATPSVGSPSQCVAPSSASTSGADS